jgi:8-oxo-dGTP pyrophosphatase MutT (NUDIX family)
MAIHPLQIEIFERVRSSQSGLRFAQMCPNGIESDLYNYHLQQLVKRGYIGKTAGLYSLTNQGREYLVDLAPLRLGQPPRLKIAAMCLVLRNNNGQLETLYQTRLREPHRGSRVMVAGGLKRGEPLLVAAHRRLLEESGLNSEPRWIGTLRKIRLQPNINKVWSDITYHICVSFEPSGQAGVTKYGSHEWITLKEASKLERGQVVGSPFLSSFLLLLAKDKQVLDKAFYCEEKVVSDIW